MAGCGRAWGGFNTKQIKLTIHYDLEIPYELDKDKDDAIKRFIMSLGYQQGGAGLDLIKHTRDIVFTREVEDALTIHK